MSAPDCFACRHNADENAPAREQIVRTDRWRVAHVTDTALPGWLVLVPLAHITSLDELDPRAAEELGPLLRDLTAALIAVTGCVKTYVLLLAEKPGFSHLHFHVVPRAEGLQDEHKGPGILSLLGTPADQWVPSEEQDRLAVLLRAELSGTPAQ